MPETRFAKIAFLLVALLLAAQPLLYAGYYAGDGVIHLCYGEQGAKGNWFEFNAGEKTPGATSVGFMLLISALYRFLPIQYLPYAVKGILIINWWLLCYLIYRLAHRLLKNRVWALGVAFFSGALPGSVLNGTNGMENGLFASVIFLWMLLAEKNQWFDPGNKKELLSGALLGLACWIRPEGFVFAALVYVFRAALWKKRGIPFSAILRAGSISGAITAIFAAGLLTFHYSQTGMLLPATGAARAILTHNRSMMIGPVPFNHLFLMRTFYYFPVAAFFLMGLRRLFDKDERRDMPVVILLCMLCSVIFFLLFSTVLAGLHIARYTLFLMPMIALAAAWAAKTYFSPGSLPKLVLFFLVALVALMLGERLFFTQPGSWSSTTYTAKAPFRRAAYSESLLEGFGHPQKRPVVIANQEVQLRYYIDDRFLIRSLDGRVDPALLNFVDGNGNFDHIGYLRFRKVDFLTDTVNYNRNPALWSLQNLDELPAGQSLEKKGIRFTRLSGRTFRIEEISPGKGQ